MTAAPVDLGAVIAHRLGLTGAIGTMAEVRDGLYTGRLVGGIMHGPAKAAAVREVAVRERLDLAQCWAYSDSVNDLPMLTAVGHPVAVNPDPALRRVAADRGWEGHDFRTGRKAAQVAIVVGAVAGAAAATVALNRRGLTRTLLAQLSKARPT